MGFFSDLRDAVTFHGDPGGIVGDIQKLSDMPGSPASLVHAVSRNKFNNPFGSEATSPDIFAGGFSSRFPLARTIGRGVGSFFLGQGAGNLLSSDAAASGIETGAGEDFGLTGN